MNAWYYFCSQAHLKSFSYILIAMRESFPNTNSTAPGPVNSEHVYANRFRITRTSTMALRNPYIYNDFVKRGFLYIRKLHYDYNKIAREPTIGCYVELSVQPDVDSILLQSGKAQRLINRTTYF